MPARAITPVPIRASKFTSKTATLRRSKAAELYGELWREFYKYPKINEATYPYQEKPGYWWFYEAGLGTNPKFFKRPDENMEGNNTSERNNSGVIHWGFGGSVVHDPDKPEESKAWIDFPKQNGLPKDHWWHIHNMLVTYRGRVRGTKNSWITIIDKGELSAYKSPGDSRAGLALWRAQRSARRRLGAAYSRMTAPGKYEDYAKDPWKTFTEVMQKVNAGTYEFFYPKKAKR